MFESHKQPSGPASASRRLLAQIVSVRILGAFVLGVLAALSTVRHSGLQDVLTAVVILALGLVGAYVLLVVLPLTQVRHIPGGDQLSPRESFEVQHHTRTTVLQFLGGLFFVVTVYVAYRNYGVSQQTLQIGLENARLANKNYEIAQKHLKLAEEGKLTDRFTKAVEQLGSDSLTVRLGGLYALERIGKDSPDDQAAVVEIVSAFIRHQAAWEKGNRPANLDESQLRKLSIVTPSGGEALVPSVRGMQSLARIDVQSAVTVLGRCGWTAARHTDLSNTDLRGANLYGAALQEAVFVKTHFEWADLRRAQLGGTRLEGAFLTEARLEGAQLAGANLDFAYLTRAALSGADLSSARLSGTDLSRAVLADAKLAGAELAGAKLAGASLRGADLTRANLGGADLDGIRDYAEIRSLRQAHVGGVRNPPKGFLEWAAANGALFDEAEWRSAIVQKP
jgi:uncharacterized protein YjbI with pentapeptide repeats